jgi:hypothetical protein
VFLLVPDEWISANDLLVGDANGCWYDWAISFIWLSSASVDDNTSLHVVTMLLLCG